MARLPGWITVDHMEVQHGHLTLLVRPRRWHPAFWWEVLKALRRVV